MNVTLRKPADAYGFSEPVVEPQRWWPALDRSAKAWQQQDITQPIVHSLGRPNRPAETDWDYVPFLDRDFTSPAELVLVPRCAPGLFTKKFVEQAPPIPIPPPGAPFVTPPLVQPPPLRTIPDAIPQAHPYLADEFFYTGALKSAC